ncbi:ionotropic receptor 40a isoform X2 [Rhodnius prolixus]
MECSALSKILSTLPTSNAALIVDDEQDEQWLNFVSDNLFKSGILTVLYRLHSDSTNNSYLQAFTDDIKLRTSGFLDTVYVFNVDTNAAETILQLVMTENVARRNILLVFLWQDLFVSRRFRDFLQEGMRVCVVINNRYGVFQVLYNQARPDGGKGLDLVNWWSHTTESMFHSPLLPPAIKTYQNFNGRIFKVPVLHKPPWNFVIYSNITNKILVQGGRDDKLLRLLSNKLNFKYEYFDPPDRSQGSAIVNGTMQGVLGLIWQRDVEMFIGDLTVTYERSLAVEFSFLTLTDSEVFLTHSPGRLNEALALIRPFQWQVWPAVVTTVLLAGPLLYALVWSANGWTSTRSNLCDCIWITTTIFLRQSIPQAYTPSRVRLLMVTLYLVSTYVIGDMYSANLTSMLARPAREKPISNLEQLYQVMKYSDFQLLVEKHSASHAVLENGTGLYKSIWEKMKSQPIYLIESTEEGMLLVREQKNVALIGGRETFLYETRRFGAHHFHLSEKLYTRYSAIALQIGCPFVHNFNDILMRLFEAGVLTKMTQEEYRKLEDTRPSNEEKKDVGEGRGQAESEDTHRMAASMEMLQGAFFLLLAGYLVAGLILFAEWCSIGKFKPVKLNSIEKKPDLYKKSCM